jgi:AraC-like DNA-binding protein
MKLSSKMQFAIFALLTEPTQEEAAKVAGCSATTLRRWLQEPEFAKELEYSRGLYRDEAVAELAKLKAEYLAGAFSRMTAASKPVP